jgi:hypothetical protein
MTPWPDEDLELERLIAQDLRAATIHEAAHATLYIFFGLPFTKVEVFTDEHPEPPDMKDYAGVVHGNWISDLPCWAMPWHEGFRLDRAVKHWDRLICIFLAGELGEAVYTGHAATSGKYDRKEIRRICCHLMGCSMPDMKDWIARLRSLTLEMLSLPAVWAAVTAVAEQLLTQAVLTRREVQALVKTACTARPRANERRSKPPARTMQHIHRLAPRLAGMGLHAEAGVARKRTRVLSGKSSILKDAGRVAR